MRSSDRSLGHSTLRMALPEKDTLPRAQQELYEYVSRLYQWRKSEPVLHTGRTMHFLDRGNTYAFFRYNDQEAVFVFVNASEEQKSIPTSHYTEILSRYNPHGRNVLTGSMVDLSRSDLTAEPLSTLIVKIKR